MFLAALLNGSAAGFISGCRNKQYAHVLKKDDKDMVGSHVAGAETWKPLIDESVGRLLAKSCSMVHQASHSTVEGEGIPIRTVCFVGVENRSAEEIGDFKEQIYEHIDSLISQDPQFKMISRRYVEAAMGECRCRPESLLLPARRHASQGLPQGILRQAQALRRRRLVDSQPAVSSLSDFIRKKHGRLSAGFHQSFPLWTIRTAPFRSCFAASDRGLLRRWGSFPA
jgi:hypothetical protein